MNAWEKKQWQGSFSVAIKMAGLLAIPVIAVLAMWYQSGN